jgi:hypothetical protein
MADIPDSDRLTERQQNALGALLNETTVRKAAAASGVPERTLYAWLKDPAFLEEYRAARRAAVQQATARLQQASTAAVNVLLMTMARDTTPAAVRVTAARVILEFAIQSVELDDLAARLEALEAKYGAA